MNSQTKIYATTVFPIQIWYHTNRWWKLNQRDWCERVCDSQSFAQGLHPSTEYLKIVRKTSTWNFLQEADAAIGGFIITPKRFETLDFTFMTWVEPYNLAVPKPQPKSRLFAFIRPFQPTVSYKRLYCYFKSWILQSVFLFDFSYTTGLVLTYCISFLHDCCYELAFMDLRYEVSSGDSCDERRYNRSHEFYCYLPR